jgi:hypothetical protein
LADVFAMAEEKYWATNAVLREMNAMLLGDTSVTRSRKDPGTVGTVSSYEGAEMGGVTIHSLLTHTGSASPPTHNKCSNKG